MRGGEAHTRKSVSAIYGSRAFFPVIRQIA